MVSIVMIASEEDLASLKETCGEGGRGGRGQKCFKPVFPITINFPDGSAVEVARQRSSKSC